MATCTDAILNAKIIEIRTLYERIKYEAVPHFTSYNLLATAQATIFKGIDSIMYKQYLILPINHASPHPLPNSFSKWNAQLTSKLESLVISMTSYLLRLFTSATEGETKEKGKAVSRASRIEVQVKDCVEKTCQWFHAVERTLALIVSERQAVLAHPSPHEMIHLEYLQSWFTLERNVPVWVRGLRKLEKRLELADRMCIENVSEEGRAALWNHAD